MMASKDSSDVDENESQELFDSFMEITNTIGSHERKASWTEPCINNENTTGVNQDDLTDNNDVEDQKDSTLEQQAAISTARTVNTVDSSAVNGPEQQNVTKRLSKAVDELSDLERQLSLMISSGNCGSPTQKSNQDSSDVINDTVAKGVVAVDTVAKGDGCDDTVAKGDVAVDTVAKGDGCDDTVAKGNVAVDTVAKGDISDDTVTKGDVSDDTVAKGDINEATVAKGDVTDATVAKGDVTDDTVAKGDVTDDTVAKGDVNDDEVAKGDVTDDTVAKGNVTDDTVSKGDVTDDTVAKGDVNDNEVAKGDVTDDTVAKGDVTDDAVAKGDVTDDTVAKGVVTDDTVAKGYVAVDIVAKGDYNDTLKISENQANITQDKLQDCSEHSIDNSSSNSAGKPLTTEDLSSLGNGCETINEDSPSLLENETTAIGKVDSTSETATFHDQVHVEDSVSDGTEVNGEQSEESSNNKNVIDTAMQGNGEIKDEQQGSHEQIKPVEVTSKNEELSTPVENENEVQDDAANQSEIATTQGTTSDAQVLVKANDSTQVHTDVSLRHDNSGDHHDNVNYSTNSLPQIHTSTEAGDAANVAHTDSSTHEIEILMTDESGISEHKSLDSLDTEQQENDDRPDSPAFTDEGIDSDARSMDDLDDDDEDEAFDTGSSNDLTNKHNLLKVDRNRMGSNSSTVSEREFRNSTHDKHDIQDHAKVNIKGYLLKLGGSGLTPKNWRKRWFVLKEDNCLYYYKHAKNKIPCGVIVLCGYSITKAPDANKQYCFKLNKGGARTYHFCASGDDHMRGWMVALMKAASADSDTGSSFQILEGNVHNVSIPALSIKDPECHGYLSKKGLNIKKWKRRYCVLKNGYLYYYSDMSNTTALGVAKLLGYSVVCGDIQGKHYCFNCTPPVDSMRVYHFSAETENDRERWMKRMEESIKRGDSP